MLRGIPLSFCYRNSASSLLDDSMALARSTLTSWSALAVHLDCWVESVNNGESDGKENGKRNGNWGRGYLGSILLRDIPSALFHEHKGAGSAC